MSQLNITSEHIEESMKGSRKTTAGGLTGTTPFHWKRWFDCSPNSRLAKCWAGITKRAYAEHFLTVCGGVFAGLCMAPWKSKAREHVRPLNRGNTERRFMVKAVMIAAKEHLRDLLEAHQVGILNS